VAGDSTGFESRHSSRYYMLRCGLRQLTSRYPKLSLVCDCSTHMILSAKAALGPRYDARDAPSILRSAARRAPPGAVLLDAGYDSERMHELILDEMGAVAAIPATIRLPTCIPPKTPNRRRMYEEFPEEIYGQRWQVESLISRMKRRLGSELRATSHSGRMAKLYAKVLTQALAILAILMPRLFYGAGGPRDGREVPKEIQVSRIDVLSGRRAEEACNPIVSLRPW